MKDPVIGMEKLLVDEKNLYKKIYSIEEKKSSAIIERDGKLLEKLSLEQEKLLSAISCHETRREKLIENYRKMNKLINMREDISLKDIAQSMDIKSSSALLKEGKELKDVLLKIGNLQDINKRLLNDNLEFFNILFSGLKSSTSIQSGYGRDGKEEDRIADSIVINKTV